MKKEKLNDLKEGSTIKFKTLDELNLDIKDKGSFNYVKFSGSIGKIRTKSNEGYIISLKNYPKELWVSKNFILQNAKRIEV